MDVDPTNMEDCHGLKTIISSRKMKIKLSKRKDTSKILPLKNMKLLNLEAICISSPIFFSDSLYAYNKNIWSKYKKLRDNKYIHEFWVSHRSIKIKVPKSLLLVTVTHEIDLEKRVG